MQTQNPQPPRMKPCRECDGMGEWEENHPQYGSPFSPEAYTLVACQECNGRGVVDDEREEE